MTWLRAVSGVLAGGLVVLVIALAVAWVVAQQNGTPGPGASTLLWHAGAALAAVLAQRQADRRRDLLGVVAALAVLAITAALVTLQWLV